MKTVVFLDVDGVLVNFDEVAVDTINRKYGTIHPPDTVPLTWNYTELLPPGADREGWFGALPEDWTRWVAPYPGAAQFTHDLRLAGGHVVLLTKCPETHELYRIQNLIENGFYFDEFYAVPYHEKKSEYINTLMGRFPDSEYIFLDDSLVNIFDVLENGPLVAPHRILTINLPYNHKTYFDPINPNEPYALGLNGSFIVAPTRAKAYEHVLSVLQMEQKFPSGPVFDPVPYENLLQEAVEKGNPDLITGDVYGVSGVYLDKVYDVPPSTEEEQKIAEEFVTNASQNRGESC